MKDRITLSSREQRRGQVLGWLLGGRLTMEEARQVLGISRRQLQRLKRAALSGGPGALAHGNRGRPSPRRLDDDVRGRVLEVARSDAYAGYNHTHLCEALAEEHGIMMSRRTLARLLGAAGMRSPRRRRPRRHRARRERAQQRGLLVQVDASDHDWLEGRGPRLTLTGAIDDATGTILAAHFAPAETSAGYLRLLKDSVRAHGVPVAWYSDRHMASSPATTRSPGRLRSSSPGGGSRHNSGAHSRSSVSRSSSRTRPRRRGASNAAGGPCRTGW